MEIPGIDRTGCRDVIFEKTSVADQLIPQPEFAFNGETYVFDNRLYFRYLKKRKTVIRKLGKAWARELQHRETMRGFLKQK